MMPPGGKENDRSSKRSLSPIAFLRPSTSITLEPSLGPFGMTICARPSFSRSDWFAISLYAAIRDFDFAWRAF